jgi:YggT family protein
VAMPMLGNFLFAAVKILDILLSIFMWALIIRTILSWVSPYSRHPMAQMLYRITEPILGLIRRRLPLMGSALDLSPMVAIFIIFFVRHFLLPSLLDIARGL